MCVVVVFSLNIKFSFLFLFYKVHFVWPKRYNFVK